MLPTARRAPLRTLPESAAESEGDTKKEPILSDDVSDFELSAEKDERDATAVKQSGVVSSPDSVSPTTTPGTSTGQNDDIDAIVKSPGSFSADSLRELDEKAISPLER